MPFMLIVLACLLAFERVQLHVPRDFPTIEAAAAAISGPEDLVLVAPGSYPLSRIDVDLHGATIASSTGDADDVIITGGGLTGLHAEAVTFIATDLTAVSMSSCVAWKTFIHGDDNVDLVSCTLLDDDLYFAPFTVIDCSLDQVTFFFATVNVEGSTMSGCSIGGGATAVRDCTVAGGFGIMPFNLDVHDCAFLDTHVYAQWFVAERSTFVNTPVTVGGHLSVGSAYGCLFKDSATWGIQTGDFQTSIDVIGCTFVGCVTDILLVQPCQFHGSAYVVNSIATVTSQAPPCEAIEINNVSGRGLVDANGFVVPGSLAEGGGNPYLVPEEYCGVNIGWDQPDPCRFVRGDVTGDGLVDGADLGALLASWGQPNVAADFNVDGIINGSDLGTLLAYWP